MFKEEQLKLIENVNEANEKEYSLCDRDNNELVKFFVTYNAIEENDEAVLISYYTKQKYRQKGYATKGLGILCKELFSKNIQEIWLQVLNKTTGSAVAENNGFFKYDSDIDSIFYVLLNPNIDKILENKMIIYANDEDCYQQTQQKSKRINELKGIREKYKKDILKQISYKEKLLEIMPIQVGGMKDIEERNIQRLKKTLNAIENQGKERLDHEK